MEAARNIGAQIELLMMSSLSCGDCLRPGGREGESTKEWLALVGNKTIIR